ncbi:MAG TPA: tRNA lysidine(34) synthetase TilS [Gemmatimonadaceae bacterium]|nr:tRNA lysidine(34) synthetase TilS [Gemmatimonadaceae bacterium]
MSHDPGSVVHDAARRAARNADAPLLLAVSGGLDSMALLHAMATSARAHIAAVATFDHGTGAAATAAAAYVARAAGAYGVRVVMGRIDDREHGSSGREAAWRAARYRFLRETARSLGARIVTAHTRDDQVETVLMRILRGSGTRGLAALEARSDVLRPLLDVSRAELRTFAHAEGVRWMEDPSNRCREHLRNRVRLDLLPALRRADAGIDDTLITAGRRAAAWRAEVEAFVDAKLVARVGGDGSLAIARTELLGYDEDSLAVMWAALAGRVGLALDRRGTRRLATFINSNRRGSIPLSGGWTVEASAEQYELRRRPVDEVRAAPLPRKGAMRWGSFRFRLASGVTSEGRGLATVGRDVWTAALPAESKAIVRPWSAGDRLTTAGGQQPRRVKRYLSDAGVHGLDRAGWPVVVAGDDVIWIPGVRRSDAATERSGRPVRHYVCERIDR